MADRNDPNRMDDSQSSRSTEKQSKRNDQNSEWLRDQVGEDHNLSGSSTYRTLPDQPEGEMKDEDPGEQDTRDRQSKR